MPDERERLRSLLARAHDPEKLNPVRKLIVQITERFAPPIKQPGPEPPNKNAAA